MLQATNALAHTQTARYSLELYSESIMQ